MNRGLGYAIADGYLAGGGEIKEAGAELRWPDGSVSSLYQAAHQLVLPAAQIFVDTFACCFATKLAANYFEKNKDAEVPDEQV